MTATEDKTRFIPWLTLALVLILTAWHFHVAQGFGVADGETLIRYGARKANHGFPQRPWRYLGSIFLHGGFLHLLSNVLILFFWGGKLERVLGSVGMGMLYLGSGLWGGLLSDVYGPERLAIGASGAVFGLVTATAVLAFLKQDWEGWNGESQQWLKLSLVAVFLNIGTAYFATRGVAELDHLAHLGGAANGVLVALALKPVGKVRPAVWLANALSLILFATAVYLRGSGPFG